MEKHTPTPWEVTPTLGKLAITRPHKTVGIALDSICHMDSNRDDGIDPEANAAFIVRVVNFHQVLLNIATNLHYPKHRKFTADCEVCQTIAKAEETI